MVSLRAVVLAALVSAVGSQVIGVDFGSDFIKIAGVKPGKMGIDVVLNEQSKRKCNNYIGFRGEDRFVGEDAYNLAPRFPTQMYTFLNRLAGKGYSEGKDSPADLFSNTWNLPYSFAKNEKRGTTDISHTDPETTYSTEELLAQILAYIRIQAANHMDLNVTGAVITIPDFLTPSERESFVHAANLTGLTCLGLMSNTLAAALQYGVQRRGFGNETLNIVIYDMGASRTEVGVFRFSPPQEENGKPKRGGELGHLETLAITHDDTLGGRTIDSRLADYLAKKFEEKNPGLKLRGVDDKAAQKAMTVLISRANKAKEVLSANKEAVIGIEDLLDGKQFYYTLQRSELDEECDDIFHRATPPLTKALEIAGLKPEDLAAVEIIGGGVRIPRLQTSLSDSLGGRSLDKTLNGDECIALGAAFHAAKLSGTFRTKGFTIAEKMPYNVSFSLSQRPGTDKEPKMRPLFTNPASGSKKSITVARAEDFDVNLYTTVEDASGAVVAKPWKTIKITDVASTLDKLGFNNEDKNASNTHAVQVQVKFDYNGLVEPEDAKVKYDEHTLVTKKIKIKEPKPEKKEEEKKEEEKKDEQEKKEEEKKEEEEEQPNAEEKDKEEEKKEDGTEEKKEEEKPEEPKYKHVTKTEIKKHRKDVSITVETVEPKPMDADDYNKSLSVLAAIQKVEDLKKEAASAKNELESYIYWVKFEGILDNNAMQEFITEEDKTAIETVVEEVTEWVEYGEGSSDSTKKSEYVDAKKKIQEKVSVVTDKKAAKDAEERKALEAELKAKLEEEKKAKEEAAKDEAKPDEEAEEDEGSDEKEAEEPPAADSEKEEDENAEEVQEEGDEL
eukprot:TRINITY_DN3024_c1_g1_i1.p1 TRINITY_DN3024_c1_g1~~TRINITY_DN3024_c1_g1_i1.p1  ORF type:complete len:841 (+),score=324.51 TRINITY_DN3024_c1_g1_i1:98-2620(+)